MITATIEHTGLVNTGSRLAVVGSGSMDLRLANVTDSNYAHYIDETSSSVLYFKNTLALCANNIAYRMKASVATDLYYISSIYAILRSEA